jgi:membrane protease YdiL (CAAX protease family)
LGSLPPPARFYRLAWSFYLVLALAGALWIGLREGPVPLRLFFPGQNWWQDLGLGLAAGALLLALWGLGRRFLAAAAELEDHLASLLGPISGTDAVALALLSGFAEELFFRGAVQGSLGLWAAAALFALVHTGPNRPFLLWTAFAAVAGLLFGGLMAWRGSLLAPISAHVVVNAVNLRALSRRFEDSGRLTGL